MSMRSYRLKHRNGLDGLDFVQDAPRPTITSDTQILIRVRALALNARDIQIITNDYPAPHAIPENVVPLSDAAGEVVEVGKAVDRFKAGDKVCPIIMQGHHFEAENYYLGNSLGGARHGVACDYFVCDQADAVKFPERLSFLEAATLPVAYLTAWTAVMGFQPKLKAGDTVLCLGTGGCSIALLQIAKAAGCRVIITSSSDKKLEFAKSLGADILVNYSKHSEWDQEVKRLTDGEGVNFVLEVSGGDTLARSIRCCKKGGIVSIIGYLSDYGDKTGKGEDIAKTIMYCQAQVRGVIVGGRAAFEDMNRAIQFASFKPVIDTVFKFEELGKAYELLANGSMIGKVAVEL